MKRFRERNKAVVGLVSLVVVVLLVVGALDFNRLPLIHSTHHYSADFPDAGGLVSGDIVTIHGVKVGSITHMALHGAMVKVSFTVSDGTHLGSDTSAAAKVLSPIGTEYMELTPSGPGRFNGHIPLHRTQVPYNLVEDLSELGSQIQQYNIPQLEKSLLVGSQDLGSTTQQETSAAFNGLARISQVLGNQSSSLATIVSQGAGLATVLSQRSGQLVNLVGQADIVLQVLEQRRTAIQQLLSATSTLGQQITSILSTNRTALTSVLTNLDSVSKVLAQDSTDFGNAIPLLAAFSKYAANATGSGPFADASIPTLLLPDNVFAQCASPHAFPSTNPQVGCRP
ncbi:MAG: MCE family protein [Acidimicrobiaceae bacterium]|nr:MCE family protein [Acidimicrobiaceae bacterium]